MLSTGMMIGLGVLAVAVILTALAYWYFNKEGLGGVYGRPVGDDNLMTQADDNNRVARSRLADAEGYESPLGSARAQSVEACAPTRPLTVSADLLPRPLAASQFDISIPTNVLANQNFLTAAQRIGADTQLNGQKIANYDLRAAIPNGKQIVSPWNNSTVEPDLNRKSIY